MKLTSNTTKKQNSKDQTCDTLIILPPCKYLQRGQEAGNTLTTTKADELQGCAED